MIGVLMVNFILAVFSYNHHMGMCQKNSIHLKPIKNAKSLITSTRSQYTDKDFPKSKALKGLQSKGYGWDKLSKLIGSKITLFGSKGIHIDDIKQGSLGDCYLLTAIGALAQHPNAIKNLFVQKKVNPYGIYGVTWIIGGEPIIMVVDQYVPSTHNQPAFLQFNGDPQIWPQILQKTYAKIYGSYMGIEGGQPRDVMHQLTGAPAWIYQHSKQTNKIDDFFKRLQEFEKDGFLFGTFTWTSPCAHQLVDGHAYTLLGVKRGVKGSDNKKYNLVKIRNPWGQQRWKGKWSDSSNMWTSSARSQVGHTDSNDGTFYMSIDDYVKCYYWTSVLAFREDYKRSYLKAPISQNTFNFNHKDSKPFFVQYDVLDARILPKQCTDNIYSIGVKVYKNSKHVASNTVHWTTYGYVQVTAGSGDYQVQLQISFSSSKVSKPQHGVFSVYSSTKASIKGAKQDLIDDSDNTDQVYLFNQKWDQTNYWEDQGQDNPFYDEKYDDTGKDETDLDYWNNWQDDFWENDYQGDWSDWDQGYDNTYDNDWWESDTDDSWWNTDDTNWYNDNGDNYDDSYNDWTDDSDDWWNFW